MSKPTFEDLLRQYGPAEAVVQADLRGVPLPGDSTTPTFEDEAIPPASDEKPATEVAIASPAGVRDSAPASTLVAGTLTFDLAEGSICLRYLWASGVLDRPPRSGIVVFKLRDDDLVFSPRSGVIVGLRQKTAAGCSAEASAECLARINDSAGVDMLIFRVVSSADMEKTGRIEVGTTQSVVSGKPSVRVTATGQPVAEGETAPPGKALTDAESSALWRTAMASASRKDFNP